MLPDRLVTMANQIGQFFAVQGAARGGDDRVVADIANHMRKFWDPRMRAAILVLSDEAASRLDPLPRRAIQTLEAARATRTAETVKT